MLMNESNPAKGRRLVDAEITTLEVPMESVGVHRQANDLILCGKSVCGQPACAGRNRMNEPRTTSKPFAIPKQMVMAAFRKIRANKGGPKVLKRRPHPRVTLR